MINFLLIAFIVSFLFNAFFVHYLFKNDLEITFDSLEKEELHTLQVAIERINGVQRDINENPEVAYKEVKKIARLAIDEVLARRASLK